MAKKADTLNDHQIEELASTFQALADPTRLRILSALLNDELSVTAIAEQLSLSQSNVSRHLSILLGAQLITKKAHGRMRYYTSEGDFPRLLCGLACGWVKQNADRRLRKVKG